LEFRLGRHDVQTWFLGNLAFDLWESLAATDESATNVEDEGAGKQGEYFVFKLLEETCWAGL
jgi:hypothetical protein